MKTLTGGGALVSTYQVTGIGPTLNGRNGGGDLYFTDGEVTIGVIAPNVATRAMKPTAVTMLPNPQLIRLKGLLWSSLIGAARFLHLIAPERRG